MTRAFCYRAGVLIVSFVVAFGSIAEKAPAALDMAVGARKVVKGAVSACNSAAKSALDSVLQDAQQIGTGNTGEWVAYGPSDSSANGSTAAAAIHCYPLDDSFLVTFTCTAQIPPYSGSAAALCEKLAAAFDSNEH